MLADSGFQDDSRVILKEILQSFAECDEFVVSLDPVRLMLVRYQLWQPIPHPKVQLVNPYKVWREPEVLAVTSCICFGESWRCSGRSCAWSGGVWNYLKLRPRAIVVRLSVLQEVYDET